MPEFLDDQLQVRQIQILADGGCDEFSIANVAVDAMLGMMDMVETN
jgi:hypothetical protein